MKRDNEYINFSGTSSQIKKLEEMMGVLSEGFIVDEGESELTTSLSVRLLGNNCAEISPLRNSRIEVCAGILKGLRFATCRSTYIDFYYKNCSYRIRFSPETQ